MCGLFNYGPCFYGGGGDNDCPDYDPPNDPEPDPDGPSSDSSD